MEQQIVEPGRFNRLRVVKQVDFGIYLDGGESGEILMPKQYVPAGTEPGNEIDAFIYFDSEDRIVATTLQPKVQAGGFASLKVVSSGPTGAFLDWGLPKDIFVPLREQYGKMEVGRSYVVFVHFDSVSGRMVATTKFERYLNRDPLSLKAGDAVSLLLYQKTDIGYKCVVDQKFLGVIHFSDIFKPVHTGMALDGFVKDVKEDGKINLVLRKPGMPYIDSDANFILKKLEEHKGFLPLSDKTPADEIYTILGMSKKTFKKAIGSLYRERKILIEDEGIRLHK